MTTPKELGIENPMIRAQTRQSFLCSLLVIVPLIFPNPVSAGKGTGASQLDRVSYAVEGAESSHAGDAAMWRADQAAPQGPMQVSEKAAIDVGGGNRFNIDENRTIGRAYIALLHKRYGNWVDAISAYNWGPAKVDSWIKDGRPAARLLPGVANYVRRVLRESGLPPLSIAVANRTNLVTIRHYIDDDVVLPGLGQSGQPLPSLASSGRPLPKLARSGSPLSSGMLSGTSYRLASLHRVLAQAGQLAISRSR